MGVLKSKNKSGTLYACRECGDTTAKWSGKCLSCGTWDSLVEVSATSMEGETQKRGLGDVGAAVRLKAIETKNEPRIRTGMTEFDRVLGGGIVPGSLVLIGGDPGIGKSTLLLQAATLLSAAEVSVLYVTGEESLTQLKMRAERLETPSPDMFVLSETNLDAIFKQCQQTRPRVLVIDSIQTIYKSDLPGSPGSMTQLKECTLALMVHAKSTGTAIFIVGHVTKEGVLAGPRMLEHMVDTVVYFEGERHNAYRILRAVKNRFGATNEIGVFEMASLGLIQVDNPSQVFVHNRGERDPGSVVSCSVEGTRPILVEVQALVSKSNYSMPQRVSMGLDSKRLTIILALLEKFAGIDIGPQDVFVSLAGGFRVEEPAVDLAIASAVASNHLGRKCLPNTLVLGELGLNGELRTIPQAEARVREAARLGFKSIVLPKPMQGKVNVQGVELQFVKKLGDAFEFIYQT
ncbi:MAG: DNA repair protein RadA [Fibrobacterota bacterium]|nr:DNA repair protein RadA [Fibrobacterota bacterium]